MKENKEAENQINHIHSENYYDKHNLQNLNHQTMIFTENRAKESLNGLWYYTIDPYDTGLRSNWNFLEPKDETGRKLPWDYDFNDGDEIPVPSCWNMYKPEYYYYEGSAWFARDFTYRPETDGEKVFLRVGAANFEELVQLGINSNPDKPVIISETGADALASYHSSRSDLFSEEFMQQVYEKQVEIIKGLNYVKGLSPWILYDFRAERRYNKYQKGYNRKGLIAADKKTRKLAFYVLQRFYLEKIWENGENQ